MTVAVKYTEMDLLEGFHCISFSTGSVQGNFLRYEFLKKKKFCSVSTASQSDALGHGEVVHV